MTNLVKISEIRTNQNFYYLEASEAKNSNMYGYRPILLNSAFGASLKEKQITPIRVVTKETAQALNIDSVFCFDYVTMTDGKNGEHIPDGQPIKVTELPEGALIIDSGKQRFANLYRFGNKSTELKYIVSDTLEMNRTNEQTSLTQATIFSKLLGLIEAGESLSDAIKSLNLLAHWSTSTANNQKTSLKMTFKLLEIAPNNKLKNHLLNDILTYNNIRNVWNYTTKQVKEAQELKNNNLAFYLFLCNFIEYCGKNVSFSRSKVVEYCDFLTPQNDEEGTPSKVKSFDKETVKVLETVFEGEELDIIKSIKKLPLETLESSNLYDVATGRWNVKNLINTPAEVIDEAKKQTKERDAAKIKSLFNKVFTVSKIDKDTEKIEVSQLFLNFLESIDDSERGLLFEAVQF